MSAVALVNRKKVTLVNKTYPFFFSFSFFRLLRVKGVGEAVNRLELMDIASANEDDDHVIMVRTYGDLKRAVKKAVAFKKGNCPN